MKNKIIFIFIFAAISAAGIAGLIFVMQKGTKSIPTIRPATELITESQSKEELEKLTVMDTAYFSFVIPDGWTPAILCP